MRATKKPRLDSVRRRAMTSQSLRRFRKNETKICCKHIALPPNFQTKQVKPRFANYQPQPKYFRALRKIEEKTTKHHKTNNFNKFSKSDINKNSCKSFQKIDTCSRKHSIIDLANFLNLKKEIWSVT